jgi:RHS repeat-associated protein
MNGDGLQDVLMGPDSSGKWYVLRNTGSALVDEGPWITGAYGNWNGSPNRIRVVDMNGDGLQDVLMGPDSSGNWYIVSHVSKSPDKLGSSTNALGVTTTFNYKPLTDSSVYTKGTGATYPAVDAQYPQYVVSSKTVSNGIGGVFTSSYSYKGLKAHSLGLGSLGFSEMTTRNDDTGIQTTSYFSQDYANRTQGMLNRLKTVADNGTVLSDTENVWSTIAVGSGSDTRYRGQLLSTEVTKRDLNNAFLHREMNTYTYDGDDNVIGTNSTVYDSGSQVLRTRVTTNDYKPTDTNQWLFGLLEKSTVTATVTGQPTLTRKSSWTYDGITGRKLTETLLEPVSETVLSQTSYENIDLFGNHKRTVISGPDFTTRQTDVVYDTTGRFVTSTTNDLGHTATSTYYPDGHINAGQVNTTTSANGISTYFEYDGFGRNIKTTAAYGSADPVESYTSFEWCNDITDGNFCVTTPMAQPVYRITKSSQGGAASQVFIDQLGREVKRSSQRMDGRLAHVGNGYDALGHNTKVCDPYFDGDPEYFTDIEYDVLGRATQSTFADGQVDTVSYNGLVRTAATDTTGLNQQKIETRDSLGNLIQVQDNASNSVTYSYDSFGQMLTVTDPNSNVTTINYDVMGRKSSMDDPDKGIWSYTYNGINQLITQTDAKGQTTCSAYDELGRMVKRIDHYQGNVSTLLGQTSDATNQCAGDTSNADTGTWVYDTAPLGASTTQFALGKLHQVNGKDGFQETYGYDSYGRGHQVNRAVGSDSYNIDTSYDNLHRVDTVTYPGPSNRLQVKNVYNAIGFNVELQNAANTNSYYQAGDMDARGNITGENLGNLVTTLRDYNLQTGRLESISSYRYTDAAGSPTVQNLDVEFDKIGNLKARQDHLQGFDEDFSYDNLNRLTTAASDFGNGDIRNTSVSYDALGNILSKTGVGTYTYGGTCTSNSQQAGPHAVSSITAPKATSYCYDANGNMISGDGRTLQYSYFDKPTQIIKGSNTTNIKYGPNRDRYQRTDQTTAGPNPGTTTYTYVGGAYEKVVKPNGDTEERHFIGGIAVVTLKDRTASNNGTTQTRYLHKDHLGSTTVITDEIATQVEEFSFDAWGKRRAPNLAKIIAELGAWNTLNDYQKANLTISANTLASAVTNKGFTGHEQMDNVGLIHMNGRVYDADIGRFISADPFIQDRTNLQALNRYSYVQNNPLSYTDPSGYFLKKAFKKLKKAIKSVVKAHVKAFKALTFKPLKKVLQSEIGRIAVAAVASYFTFGAASGWVLPHLANIFAGAMTITASQLAVVSTIGGVIAGSAAGFVGGAIMSGNLKGGLKGATSGAVFGGVNGFYGNNWSLSRAGANGLAGGVTSKVNGGEFKDGFNMGLVTSMMRVGWEYTKKVTNNLKLLACENGGEKCVKNKWGELLTDGGRDIDDQTLGYGPQKGNFITRGGMAQEGGKHLYSTDSWVGRFVNKVSKTHDWMNSNLSRSVGFHGYNSNTGFWLSGSNTQNTMFQVYSFSGMLPAAAYTAGAMSASMPVTSIRDMHRENRD